MTGLEVALATGVPALVGIIGGWVIGKRKNKAEASLLEIKAVTAMKEFYESVLNDTKKQLDFYIKQTEMNRIQLEKQRVELIELKDFMHQVLNQSCTVANCPNRQIILTYLKNNKNENSQCNLESSQE